MVEPATQQLTVSVVLFATIIVALAACAKPCCESPDDDCSPNATVPENEPDFEVTQLPLAPSVVLSP
jgi:hypothetical protein